MHDHDNNKGMGSMMWMMVVCCAIPLVLILVLGVGSRASGTPSWVVFSGVAVMLFAHFFMMRRSHKHSNEEHKMIEGEDKNNKNHSDHGCCR